MVTLRNRAPMPAELLAGTKVDALAKYVKGAEMELEGLEVRISVFDVRFLRLRTFFYDFSFVQGAMPRGSVARSFPKEERELKALFAHGLQKLQSIEKQASHFLFSKT